MKIRNTDAEIEDGRAGYSLQLRIPPGRSVQEIIGEISGLPTVKSVKITGLQEVE